MAAEHGCAGAVTAMDRIELREQREGFELLDLSEEDEAAWASVLYHFLQVLHWCNMVVRRPRLRRWRLRRRRNKREKPSPRKACTALKRLSMVREPRGTMCASLLVYAYGGTGVKDSVEKMGSVSHNVAVVGDAAVAMAGKVALLSCTYK